MSVIGIIGAMENEVAELKRTMEIEETLEKAGREFCHGKLNGREVVVVVCGVGKVVAGICAQILIDVFNVDYIINTGIAGSLKNEIDIGDIVISTDALQHDVDAGYFGYPLGQIPQMDVLAFKADEHLIDVAYSVNSEVNKYIKTFKGRIVSGDMFVSTSQQKQNILSNFPEAYCTEMEGAAIAQCAHINKVPYVIIRAISDKADESIEVDYNEFESGAIRHSVKLTKEMINQI